MSKRRRYYGVMLAKKHVDFLNSVTQSNEECEGKNYIGTQ